MKRIVILAFAVICASVVSGQEKQKVAIYTDDKSGKNCVELVDSLFAIAIVKHGVYEVAERTGAFLQRLSRGQDDHKSGSVSDAEMIRVEAPLQLVCAVKIGVMDGRYFIYAGLIDAGTAGIEGATRPQWFSAAGSAGLEKACEDVAASLFGGGNRSVGGFGQENKKKIAVYIDDKSGKNYADFIDGFLKNAIVEHGVYAVFLQQAGKEQEDRRNGTVSEDLISQLGKQLGVQMVCAVKIGEVYGLCSVSASLIDVETAGVENVARAKRFSAGDFEGFEKACEGITASLFGERGGGSTNKK
jgi:hypothetical protein